ncbi:Integrase core domain [Chlamydia trachomatis]|nr:Integrase core domain [Chlamydia trachomatis]
MDIFHFPEFGSLKYVHHTIDMFSGFQWATAFSSEKADSVITHLLEVMAVMVLPAQIKTDNAPACVSSKLEQFFKYYNIKLVPGIPYNPTGQAVVERAEFVHDGTELTSLFLQLQETIRNRTHPIYT